MMRLGLKMLFGDPIKCLGLVFGVALCTLLICQQVSIFLGLLGRSSSVINDAAAVDVWVMDPAVKTIDVPFPLRETALGRVRGVDGVAWAVPFFKENTQVKTHRGTLENGLIVGLDDATLVGVPDKFVLGTSVDDVRRADAIAMNPAGFRLLYPGEQLELGRELEINDRRAVITAFVEASPAFAANLLIYTPFTRALTYTNGGRNRLSFVLAKVADGQDPEAVAAAITEQTGLKAVTSATFRGESIAYILANTGIPASFGTVVFLGVLIGIAIVGLTFNQFIMENIKQYAALKAIGVRNGRLLRMTLGQSAFVTVIGYGLGLLAAATFFRFGSKSDALRGFYLLPEVAVGVFVLAGVIVLLSTLVSMRKVLAVDPATVFRG